MAARQVDRLLPGPAEPLLFLWRRFFQHREQQSLASVGGLLCGAQQVQSLHQQVSELDCTAFMPRMIVLIAIVVAIKVT